ncbi:hypothetical protein J31TS3_38630 [Paenibacillus lactis]|nr:hypothetical protein J31TS3_38630 [Paenibacillus lactis]
MTLASERVSGKGTAAGVAKKAACLSRTIDLRCRGNNNSSGVTGDEVDETTVEHRSIRPVAWAKSIGALRVRRLLFFRLLRDIWVIMKQANHAKANI